MNPLLFVCGRVIITPSAGAVSKLCQRVIPARMKRVALEEPHHSEIPAFHHPVFFEGMPGIGRARGIKTTGRRPKRGDEMLIYSDQKNRYIPEFIY